MSEINTQEMLGAVKQFMRKDIPERCTLSDSGEALTNMLVELNGGKRTLDIRTFRPGTELFAFVEQLITEVENETFKGDEFFTNFVDYRNIAEGDKAVFRTENTKPFMVSKIGRGNQAIARQRIGATGQIEVPTMPRAVRVSEHISRILAGRVDFASFISLVAKSVQQQQYADIYDVFLTLAQTTPGMYNEVVYSGSYNEKSILSVIKHVEADNNGAQASIIGPADALRRLQMTTLADDAKSDLYNVGYFGKFYGTPAYSVKPRYKAGTHQFLWPDNRLYVVSSKEKWIKFVTEGVGYMELRNFTENFDMTNEYWYITQYGIAILLSHAIGICDFTD